MVSVWNKQKWVHLSAFKHFFFYCCIKRTFLAMKNRFLAQGQEKENLFSVQEILLNHGTSHLKNASQQLIKRPLHYQHMSPSNVPCLNNGFQNLKISNIYLKNTWNKNWNEAFWMEYKMLLKLGWNRNVEKIHWWMIDDVIFRNKRFDKSNNFLLPHLQRFFILQFLLIDYFLYDIPQKILHLVCWFWLFVLVFSKFLHYSRRICYKRKK